ncbi:hypothetical protein [Paraburkholderia sp. C35]|uniref:hypothetical protein n=1 Tax=Paraburkholderia sp. C35 TaxID=2126993 RepID=UPI000D688D32|nr:hypothetical protein [Paraburkholderia sp. C35]
MIVYLAKLKTRKEMEQTIPRDEWGWWHDVCPGETLILRDATEGDFKRVTMNENTSTDPTDYLCETCERPALVSRKAVEWLSIMVPVTHTGATVTRDNTMLTKAYAREVSEHEARERAKAEL